VVKERSKPKEVTVVRYVEKGVMRYLVVVMVLGLAIPASVGIASAQEVGHVRVLPYGNGQSSMCEVDGTFRDCYEPAPVTLYPPSQVGTTAGEGDRVRVLPYGNGQSSMCDVNGQIRDCYEPAPVTLFPPSELIVPAGGSEQSITKHEAGGENEKEK
jgi:hypothetical protein